MLKLVSMLLCQNNNMASQHTWLNLDVKQIVEEGKKTGKKISDLKMSLD